MNNGAIAAPMFSGWCYDMARQRYVSSLRCVTKPMAGRVAL